MSVDPANAEKNKANVGNTVTVIVSEIKPGYQAGQITVTKEKGGEVAVSNGTFKMPADNVSVSVAFNAIEYTITTVVTGKSSANIPE